MGGWGDVAVLMSVTDRSSVVGNFEESLSRGSAVRFSSLRGTTADKR